MEAFKTIQGDTGHWFSIEVNKALKEGYEFMAIPHTNRKDDRIEHIAYMAYNGDK